MQLMQFKTHTWPYNPVRISLSYDRDLRLRQAMGAGALFSDFGRTPIVIEGEGELFGPQRAAQFERLRRIYLDEGSGKLILPSFSPVYAYFKELSLVGEGALDSLRYRFVFWEDTQRTTSGGQPLSMGALS